MNLASNNPAFLGNLFFALAHVVSWIILIWYGHKHKYPIISWLLIIVTGYIFFTIGSHLLAFDVKSLVESILEKRWPASEGTSLVSGLLLAIPAMLLMKYLLHFRNLIFEPYAFTIPLGIAIQRFGCLAAGCCYGTHTKLPWGISYQFGHKIHFTQWSEGLLASSELQSLPIHPVQLYESAFCLLIVFILIRLYKKKSFSGRLVYVSLFFYGISRIITEFYRADAAHTIGTSAILGLNSVQWILLFACLYLAISLFRRRQNHPKVLTTSHLLTNNITWRWAWYLLLFALILLSSGFYSAVERLLLGVLFVPLSSLLFWDFFKMITVKRLRIATVGLSVSMIFLMSQVSPVIQEEDKPKKYHEVSIGGYTGSNSMTHYYTTCDGDKIEDNRFKEKYYQAGIGYKYVTEFSQEKKLTLGLGASYGKLEEEVENINYTYSQTTYSISPYVQYDLKKVGFGLGLVAGDIGIFREEYRPFSIFKRYSLLPQVHFRYGNSLRWWGEFNYGYRFPGISPANEYELLIGIRGEKGNVVRFGTSAFNAVTIRPIFYVDDKIGIEPYVGFLGPLISSSYTDRIGFQAGLNLHYRFYR